MRRQTREGWARLGGYFDGYVWFFSEDPRTDGEKAPIREFLRYLGVGFTEQELVVRLKDDDVDVRFREARFQSVERIVAARRRREEVQQFAERVRTAREVAARGVPRGDSVPMRVRELLREVHKALGNESRKTVNRAALDALVYVNLRGRHPYPAPDVIEEDTRAVANLGWRSVSVLWPPYRTCGTADGNAGEDTRRPSSRKRTALARATGRRTPLRHPRSAAGTSRARTRFRLRWGVRTSVTDGPPAPRPNGP